MKQITNWLYQLWYAKQLLQIKELPFKMKIEVDALRSNAIVQMENEIEPIICSIKQLMYSLKIGEVHSERYKNFRDHFGFKTVMENPVATENEVAEIRNKLWIHRTLIILFICAETFLYDLISSLFIPGAKEWVRLCVSVFLAVVIMCGLNIGLQKHYLYREACEKKLDSIEKRKYNDERIKGYALIILSFVAIIFASLARIKYLEHIPPEDVEEGRLLSVLAAGKMASIFTMAVTFIAGITMAILKYDLLKLSAKAKVIKAWEDDIAERDEIMERLIAKINEIKPTITRCVEKAWQLATDLKRVYRMNTEYDEKYEPLNTEYEKLKAGAGFVINEDVYRKFAPIQCAHEELFKYGLVNLKEVQEKVAFADELEKFHSDLVEELKAKNELKPEAPKNDSSSATNPKKNVFTKHLKIVPTSMLLLLFTMLFGCKEQPEPMSRNNIVGVDLSTSRDSITKKWYKEAAQNNIIAVMGKRDMAIFFPVDRFTEVSSSEYFRIDFSQNKYKTEYSGLDKEKAETRKHNKAVASGKTMYAYAFDSVVRARSGLEGGTDIFGAFRLATTYVIPGKLNTFILFSDMLHFSDKCYWNFEDKLNDTCEIQKYLTESPDIDLNELDIAIVTGGQTNISQRKYYAVKLFWQRYIEKCGGRLICYSSGSTSQLADFLKSKPE